MKTLGLLGGLTFESTALYYDIINRFARLQLGPRASAPLFIYSANQEEMLQHAVASHWSSFAAIYVNAANALITGGASAIVICASLPHRFAEDIEREVSVPVLHVADFLGAELKARGVQVVGLLGAMVVMEGDFFGTMIEKRTGVKVLTPESKEERIEVDKGIVEELATGIVKEVTKKMFLEVVRRLVERGVEGVILGSTDLGFVINPEDVSVPVFDSARVHALGVARCALEEER